MTITPKQAKETIENVDDGRIFTVTFVKRSTGETRVMNCRKGVVRHLTGGEKKYDPKEHGLVCVFDMQKQGYRSIALESIKKISMQGEVFEVE